MIRPELLTFSQLLSEKLFIIPDYQRSYSWEKKHRQALFNDIETLYKKLQSSSDASHFMSTLVCLKKEEERIRTTVYHKYDVVDGQQRLTTLIILLKCIALKMDKKDSDYADLTKILVKQDNNTTPILLMNHDERQIFYKFIKEGKKPNAKNVNLQKSDALIYEAIVDCTAFVEDWCQKKELSELFALLKNNLYFVFHAIENESMVYKIFEVLNSRGLAVEWLDRLKCAMLGILFEKGATVTEIDAMHKTWSNIYQDMGVNKNYGTMAMRYLAASKGNYSRIRSEEDCMNELLCLCNDISETLEIAANISDLINDIKNLEEKYFNSILMELQYPRFLALCIEKSQFLPQEKENLFEAWEKSTFKIFGLERRDSRFKVGDFTNLGQDIYKNEISYEDALTQIKNLSADCNIDKDVDELLRTDIYNEWASGFKYLMYKREQYLANHNKNRIAKVTWKNIWLENDTDSIEHILPQYSRNAVDELRKAKKDKIFVHRLGNLLILDINKNKSLQNTPPDIKAASYNDLYIEKEVAEIIRNQGWNKKAIENREKALKEWILEEWGNGNEK